MDSVFVIEIGEYSDYRVAGVYTSRENAQRIVDAIMAHNDDSDRLFTEHPTIAEWPLDPALADILAGHGRFIVWMHRDGTVERCDPEPVSVSDLAPELTIWRRTQAPSFRGKGIPDCLQGSIWARDADHAVKIVNEKRAQLIAAGQWE